MEDKKNEKISKKIILNIILLIIIEGFLSALYFISLKIEENIFFNGMKYGSFVLLGISIAFFEIAYSKDKGTIAIYGIETLMLAINTLVSVNILKMIIIYTTYKRKYLKDLSDIKEIVSTKPIKKEAKRKEIE